MFTRTNSPGRRDIRLGYFLLLCVFSCTINQPYRPPHSGVSLQLITLSKERIDSNATILLSVAIEGDTIVTKKFADNKKTIDTLELPIADSVWFFATVIDDSGNLLYRGQTVKTVTEVDFVTITIDMERVLPESAVYVGLSPKYSTAQVGQVLTIELIAQQAIDLFGFSCEILFDTTMVRILSDSMKVGTLLGSDVISIFKVDHDTLSIGITRKAGSGGVSGEGVISSFGIEPLRQGISNLRILDNNFKMTDSKGVELVTVEELLKDDAEIEAE